MSEEPTAGDGAARGDDPHVTRRALLTAAAGAGVAGTAGCAGVTTPADVAASGSFGNFGYAATARWVADNRERYLPVDARDRASFRTERIYGASHLPGEPITARRETRAGLVPDADAIARAVGDAGIRRDDDVVVYGSSVGSRVTRAVFALSYLGHGGDVRVLDGGYEAWNGRTGTGRARPPSANYEPEPASDAVVTRSWIAERLGTFGEADGPALLDVRPPEAYLAAAGSDALDPANDRHGHIPGATNVHWLGNVAGRRLKPPGELAQLYFGAAGLSETDTVVVYGNGNVNPTHTVVVLRALGIEDVRLYDGGFAEWANVTAGDRADFPVETKTRAVVETSGEIGGDDGGFSCTG